MIDREAFFAFFFITMMCIAIFSFATLLVMFQRNSASIANCRMLEKNGHDTHLETYWFFFKDCYVGNVPYDRYIRAELK